MSFTKLTKQRAIAYLTSLLNRYSEAWAKPDGSFVAGEGRAWYEDVKLAMQRIYGSDSAEYRSFSGLFAGSPWGSDIVKVFFFVKGRVAEIEFWDDDNTRDARPEAPPKMKSNQFNPAPEDGAKRYRIFIVHGRDERLRSGVFTFLRSLGLQPLEFGEARELTGKPMPYVGEILDAAFQHAQAVVVLLTPDDEARLRGELAAKSDPLYEKELTGQARPNVLFEAGMSLVSHPDRTILVQFGHVRPFSDVAGRHILHMNNSLAKRQDLAQRLEAAKCLVNLKGTDWHTSGDLNPPEQPVGE